jgi:hypothetical protein
MTPTANLASAEADADHLTAPAAEAGPFVLNLCSSTTPMALAQTDLPELKRFTFFVSRRFEEGRERFRLHMGFFASQAEAEEWLGLVREIYPGAWAGEAPGKKLRARAAEAAAAQARHAVGPQPSAVAPAAPAQTLPPPAAARRESAQPAAPLNVLARVPTLHPPAAAPRPATAPAAPRQIAAPVKAAPRMAPAAPAPRPQPPRAGAVSGSPRPAAKTAPAKPAASSAVARPAPAKPPSPAVPARPTAQAPSRIQQPAKKPIFTHSNVKEVLAALDTPEDATGETRLMPAPPVVHEAPAADSTLTDTQVLRFLESRREESGTGGVDPAAESGISLLKPDDTGTRRALKEAVTRRESVSFAVQLQWSVQAVELEKVPPLAIFSAYTLYSVEGSREGRKWYGLRLGFFNDAISAKQVAYYVRSEFASVAVVPVSAQERLRATEDNQRFAGVGPPRKRSESVDNEFKLIDSDTTAAQAPRAAPAAAPSRVPAASQAAAPQPAAPQAAATRKARKSAGEVGAHERRTPQTLEETLEILGANELAIDNGSSDSLSDTGVRHLRVEVQKNTPFSRLLERLSERVRKS